MSERKENWYLLGKDPDGLYCLRRSVDYGKSFSAAIFFDKIHEYNTRYELLRREFVIAVLYKKTARVNGISAVEESDIKEMGLNAS